VIRRLTIKSSILLVICIAYFISGFQVYNISAPSLAAVRAADPSITAHTDLFTLHQIGLIFMITTTIAGICALTHKATWGYSLMTFVLVWWASLYIVSWVQVSYWQSVYGFVSYGLTAFILILCSKIVEFPVGMRESANTPLPLLNLEEHFNNMEGESK
jgi:hypothetical protein